MLLLLLLLELELEEEEEEEEKHFGNHNLGSGALWKTGGELVIVESKARIGLTQRVTTEQS